MAETAGRKKAKRRRTAEFIMRLNCKIGRKRKETRPDTVGTAAGAAKLLSAYQDHKDKICTPKNVNFYH